MQKKLNNPKEQTIEKKSAQQNDETNLERC
jgi:hypothetical protein